MLINAPISNKLFAKNSKLANQQFLNNMSLEIRNPINSILGFAELLANKENSLEEKIEFLNRINSSCVQLMNAIEKNNDFTPPQVKLLDFKIDNYSQMNFDEKKYY